MKRRKSNFVSRAHISFIGRQQCCAVCGNSRLAVQIQACHLRLHTDGGMGMKPSDYWVWPGCLFCHSKQHRIGEKRFWEEVRIDPWKLCLDFALKSECEKTREVAKEVFTKRFGSGI